MALLLTVACKVNVYDRATRHGIWRWQSGAPIHRLRGSVLGLLSFGAIARAIAARATGFGMRITTHDPYLPVKEMAVAGAKAVSFDELVTESDCLVIQAPLTSQTHHLFDEVQLRRMKPTAILINTARGLIIDDRARHRALSEGWIAGAGLDDIEEEPAKVRDWRPDNPLFRLDNVVITPHAAYYSEEAIDTVRHFAAEEVVRVLTGQPPLSPVNAGDWSTRAGRDHPRAGERGDIAPTRRAAVGNMSPGVSGICRPASCRTPLPGGGAGSLGVLGWLDDQLIDESVERSGACRGGSRGYRVGVQTGSHGGHGCGGEPADVPTDPAKRRDGQLAGVCVVAAQC
jgi:hypothetical protein